MDYKCSSSWYFSNDITDIIAAVTSSPIYTTRIPELSINGYYASGGQNTFVADVRRGPWVEYDFGKVVQIQKVIVKARNFTAYSTDFQNVVAKVGNTSSLSGNFAAATLLAQHTDLAEHGEVIVFESPNPIWGRYLSFKRTDIDSFIMAEINVLGEG